MIDHSAGFAAFRRPGPSTNGAASVMGLVATTFVAGALAATSAGGDPDPCELPCPEGAIVEIEPCEPGVDDTVNGGCNFGDPFNPQLVPVVCGSTYCGSVWAEAGTWRELDWFEHSADAPNQVQMHVTANFAALVIHLGVNLCCASVTLVDATTTRVCGTASVETIGNLMAGDASWWIVTTVGFEGVPCSPAAEYVVSFSCAPAPPVPCPALGDADGDGFVDFDDLLVVLANIGPCPSP